ncbi:hypothetical protein EJB05_31248, partial [Eragrostis curvula]
STMASAMAAVLVLFSVLLRSSLVGFYNSKCRDAEDIVRSTVEEHFNKDATIAPGLLRLHFHDCFIQTLGPSWPVPLGRRDGRVSSASDAVALPGPDEPVSVQRQKFADKGLTDKDLVTLVGKTNHPLFVTTTIQTLPSVQLHGDGQRGPDHQPGVPAAAAGAVPAHGGDPEKEVALDKDTPGVFDVSFFKNVRDGNVILESDQRLWGDAATRDIVQKYAGSIRGLLGFRFGIEFPRALVKMSSIGVKTGSQGEIRKQCSRFN